MAVDFLAGLRDLTFSKFEKPDSQFDVIRNVLRASIWGAIATASIAAVAALFSRGVIERDAIAPYVLKVSLMSCWTFTLFAAAITYNSASDWIKTNAQTFFLEKLVSLIYLVAASVAILARYFFNPNQMIKSLAERAIHPPLWIGLTSTALGLFHFYQNKQIGETHDSIF